MNFGFTNDKERYAQAVTYREAAVNDGWDLSPTYPPHPEGRYSGESVDRASTLVKEGFKMMIYTRTNEPPAKWEYEVSINIWGPDGLAIHPPNTYDWAAVQRELRRCGKCRKEDVDTYRVGFANRVCAKCRPSEKKRIEVPGWCD